MNADNAPKWIHACGTQALAHASHAAIRSEIAELGYPDTNWRLSGVHECNPGATLDGHVSWTIRASAPVSILEMGR